MERLKRILIVDDEPTILLSLPYCLEGDGVEVATSSRLDEAKDAISRTFFDLVVTDVRMSGICCTEGLDLIEFIRKKSPDTKVMVMTAYGTDGSRDEALRLGAHFYYDKPLDIDNLVEKVREMGIPAGGSSRMEFLNKLKKYRML